MRKQFDPKRASKNLQMCGQRETSDPNMPASQAFTLEDKAMAQRPQRIANHERTQILRISILIPAALFLSVACQWAGAGRLPATSNAESSVQPTGSKPEASPAPRGVTPASSVRFTEADFAHHVEEIRARIKKLLPSRAAPGGPAGLPPAEFSIVIQAPFVVIGDESRQAVQQHAEGTVKWAVERLKQDFFLNDPKDILDIWLFKDAASYEKHARVLFGETPTTPYGYYSSDHKALIMNIETGGGTLVHEIVHPFMEANFPACPPWLNEGLGSLYEQCGDVKGHIYGFTNWRLPGLQRAIRSAQVPSFRTLTAMDTSAFYDEDRGTNYAQARYLCYYMQEKGVLLKFYKEFHAHQKEDPTGLDTLKQILAEADMDAFKTKWEKYVLALRQGYEVTIDTAP